MPGMPQARGGEIGETVASFPTYEGAQKAVSALIAADVPARDIAIVGSGLRSIERVTGRLGYATAARQGAINGLLLGLFFSAIFVLGNSAVPVSAFVGVLFVGVALGMLMSIGAYAIVRRRRDFASVMQVVADHYEVTVLPTSIHRAREVMGPMSAPPAPRPPRAGTDERSAPPEYGERSAPPEYGERVAPPEYGVRVDEPPRYGERIVVPPPAGHGEHAQPGPEDAAGRGGAQAPASADAQEDAGTQHNASADAGTQQNAPEDSAAEQDGTTDAASGDTAGPVDADDRRRHGDAAGDTPADDDRSDAAQRGDDSAR